jgi:hypothetical protein
MKLVLLTAALIACPAVAQTQSTQVDASASTGATPNQDPIGGYIPSEPALSGPVTPETIVTFRPSPPPSQVFPAPPPMNDYPICEPGQFDNCRQRGG